MNLKNRLWTLLTKPKSAKNLLLHKGNLLIEKKDKDKRFIKNWRPTSSLNGDYKIISKDFSGRLKKVFPLLISSQQTAYS